MELQTISQVSKEFGVSTRTLRYYEQVGLIESKVKDGYAYRTYDHHSVVRLQQTLFLRKLRIPLRRIKEILDNGNAADANELLSEHLREVDEELKTLSAVRAILGDLLEELQSRAGTGADGGLLSSESILDSTSSLPLERTPLKEGNRMDELKGMAVRRRRLTDVRIIHVPPFTAAASHYLGENPEENAGEQLCRFLRDSRLYEVKPDARVFGFNHPSPSPERPDYGYELWATIPDAIQVSPPLKKVRFSGGLYAAHMIVLGNFHEWKWLSEWVDESSKYEPNCLDDEGAYMGGLLEEHLNFVYHAWLDWPDSDEHQLDLLFPIKTTGK